eukprot:gene23155-30006_t
MKKRLGRKKKNILPITPTFDVDSLTWSDDENDPEKYSKTGSNLILNGSKQSINIMKDNPYDNALRRTDESFRNSLFYGSLSITSPQKDKNNTILLNGSRKELINQTLDDYNTVNKSFVATVPVPDVSANCSVKVGARLLNYTWFKFQEFGADEAEMIQVKFIKEIFDPAAVRQAIELRKDIPYKDLKQVYSRLKDEEDYVEFVDLVEDLAARFDVRENYFSRDSSVAIDSPNLTGQSCFSINPNGRFVPCCTNINCRHQWNPDPLQKHHDDQVEDEDEDAKFTASELLRIENNGKMRVRILPEIMKDLGIQMDKRKLPKEFWELKKDFLIYDLTDLKKWVDKVRYRAPIKFDILDSRSKYSLPQWLKEEFKLPEILLYEHHFSMIDLDGGGTVDASELQQLLSSFGTAFSLQEAQNMLDEFDIDGNGTMDFIEFMILIYRIQRNAVNLESNELALAMSEAKIVNFGGAVIVCDLLVNGPKGSLYEGGAFHIQMTFRDGYPHIAPDVCIVTRIWALHVLCQVDGRGRFLPLLQDHVWQSTWNIRKLLEYATMILQGEPSVTGIHLLPSNLKDIAYIWVEVAKEYYAQQPPPEEDYGDGVSGAQQRNNQCNGFFPIATRSEAESIFFEAVVEYISSCRVPPPSLSLLCGHKNASTCIRKLSRVEQLHLNVLYTYIFSRDKYNELAGEFSAKYRYQRE